MNNPLRQYFRRPALHIKLPSGGKFYPAGTINLPENGELPVFPMTAIDEITSKTPDALFNGSAVVDIISSCIPGIIDPWVIPSMDMDTLLIAIRTATNGNDLEVTSICPKCENDGTYGINLINLLNTIQVDGYDKPLVVGELKLNFRPLHYRQVNQGNLAQFDIQREIEQFKNITDETERSKHSSNTMKKLTEMNMDLIAYTIESIILPAEIVTDREFITEYLHSCDRNTYELIRKHVVTLRENTTTKPLKIKCVNCQHEYDQSLALNVSDFFG
jgi:hypothetical protein